MKLILLVLKIMLKFNYLATHMELSRGKPVAEHWRKATWSAYHYPHKRLRNKLLEVMYDVTLYCLRFTYWHAVQILFTLFL